MDINLVFIVLSAKQTFTSPIGEVSHAKHDGEVKREKTKTIFTAKAQRRKEE